MNPLNFLFRNLRAIGAGAAMLAILSAFLWTASAIKGCQERREDARNTAAGQRMQAAVRDTGKAVAVLKAQEAPIQNSLARQAAKAADLAPKRSAARVRLLQMGDQLPPSEGSSVSADVQILDSAQALADTTIRLLAQDTGLKAREVASLDGLVAVLAPDDSAAHVKISSQAVALHDARKREWTLWGIIAGGALLFIGTVFVIAH